MPNTILTPKIIAQEALMVLESQPDNGRACP